MRIALVGAELEENLAVRYMRGALEAEGHEVEQLVFDRPRDRDRVARQVAASGAAVTGLSMVFTARARQFADLARSIRAEGYRGLLIAGGHFAAFNADALLRDLPELDAVGIGEGEGILCELARSGDMETVAGLVWRRPGGAIVQNPPAPTQDLDSLPWPTHMEPFARYHGIPIVDVLSSRGCSHACAFCSIAAWHRLCGGPRLRTRSAGAVADELAHLHGRGVRIFNFHDDNFLPRDRSEALDRVRELAQAFHARGLDGIGFAIKARPDSVHRDLFEPLVAMGLFRVFLGIEAGTAGSLRRLGRGQTVTHNDHALRVLNDLGLHVCYNLLLLEPDTTLEELAGNIAFLRAHPDNPMNFCRTEVYAGTPLEARLRDQGRLLGDYWGHDYRIADERSQRAFEAMRVLFHERVYGMPGVHHLAMQVDYQLQLLEQFFGRHARLREQVEAFVRRVNGDTCDQLDAVVQAVATGEPAAAIVSQQRAAVDGADDRLMEAGLWLLEALRGATEAVPKRPAWPWVPGTAAAGIAATVALTPGCCRGVSDRLGDGYHYSEMVAEPVPEDMEAMRQAARQLLPLVAPRVTPGNGLSMDLYIVHTGVLEYCNVREHGGAMYACPVREGLPFPERAHGNSDVPSFSAAEVDEARALVDVVWPVSDGAALEVWASRASAAAWAGFASVARATVTLYVDATPAVYFVQVEGDAVDDALREKLRGELQGQVLPGGSPRDVRLVFELTPDGLKAAAARDVAMTEEERLEQMKELLQAYEMVAIGTEPMVFGDSSVDTSGILPPTDEDWHHAEMVAPEVTRTDADMKLTTAIAGLDAASDEHRDIRRVIRRRQRAIESCYQDFFGHHGTHQGTLGITFTLGPDGRATDVRFGPDTMEHAELNACCTQQVEGWVFPAREGGDAEVSLTCELTVETETLK